MVDPRAFTTPGTLNGEAVADRWICRGCARGEPAMGRTPHIGLVCLRHRRWIGEPQRGIHTYPPALAAEHIYRRVLKPRTVLVDSFAMDLGKICANPIFIGANEIQRRTNQSGIDDTAILTYPEQVHFARLMTRKSFLEYVTVPALEHVTGANALPAKWLRFFPIALMLNPLGHSTGFGRLFCD
ncbi:hypothetical protein HBE99_11160 [Mycobacteroides chelonae]|uniref:hypothetical protein n=1 Tax=Mycobacteroides chelonae TaxID=1774 RepID=UPI00190FF12F|nr:hypothetical protein [Mycobacteroides chelonae]QQG97323.1 hypothetical protein HBE99_11160 [Mycobacteroides chelonae]